MADDTDSDRDDAGPETDDGEGETAADLTGSWTDRIVGERMQVDKEFSEKVAASHFSRQQWGLVMTAVEFEIENPADEDAARLAADTSKLPSIAPELERMAERGGGMGGMADAATLDDRSGSSSGGFLSGVKDALGIGGDDEREQLAAAEEMAQMYADDLQAKLEERGKWETVRAAARE